ncbi:MAG TPA: ribosome recycling factor [Fibrobacteria bacterium]|nr:ribosome recycling factor [Fibrobacteria bacterium]
MIDEKTLRDRMQKTVDAVRRDLAKIRTGLASPSILDNVFVDYYGTKTPIPQAAAISVPEPRTLAIKPWDKGLMQAIEKAIQMSDIGINPVNDGTYIRLNMPVLTGDRRKELAKHAKKIGEEGKVAIRNIRRDENDRIKKDFKDQNKSEDELKQWTDKIQALTDKFTGDVDKVVADKEKDILTV